MYRLFVILLVIVYCHGKDDKVAVVLPQGEIKAFMGVGTPPVDTMRRYSLAAEIAHNVGRRLQSLINMNDNRNYLISPLSVSATIGQLLLASKGPTQDKLRDILTAGSVATSNVTDVELHRQVGAAFLSLQQNGTTKSDADAYQLNAANTFFMQVGLKVKSRFLEQIKTYYSSGYFPVDFKNDPVNTKNAINKWGSDNTGGLIPEILVAPLPLRTTVVLMNALYFRAPWETPFSAQLTKTGDFNVDATRVVKVQHMRGQFDLKFAQSDTLGCRLVVLPYKSQDVKMYVLLPNVGVDVRSLVKLTWKQITDFVGNATEESVVLILPKMKLLTSLSLKEPLLSKIPGKRSVPLPAKNKAGQKVPKLTTATPLSDADRLDLTGASADEKFSVDEILHQVSLEVTETGTEAAAISIGSGYYSGNVKNFNVNRPFVFFIRHEASLVNLFFGVVTDPTKEDYH